MSARHPADPQPPIATTRQRQAVAGTHLPDLDRRVWSMTTSVLESDMNPVSMNHNEKMQLRAAAFRVTRLYPGPVGELVSRELLTWEEFGYRLGGHRLIMRLVDHVLTTPLTQTEVA